MAETFRWKPLLIKVSAILLISGTGGLTADSIKDAVLAGGGTLTPDEIMLLTWALTGGLPAVYVGVKNFLKHTKAWKKFKAKYLLIVLLPWFVVGGMCSTTTTTTVDGAVIVDSPDPAAMEAAAKVALEVTQVAFNQWFAYRAQQGTLNTQQAELERQQFERKMQFLNDLIDKYAVIQAAKAKENTQ